MSTSRTKQTGLSLKEVVSCIESLAPPSGAAEWDNTGLLWAPVQPRRIRRMLLTIDCTPDVAAEALRRQVDGVLAYHPPLFAPLKQLVPHDPLQRRLLQLIEARVALYSPHTALDAAPDGVNDWLANVVRGDAPATIQPVPDTVARCVVFERALDFHSMARRLQATLKLPYLRWALPRGRLARVRRVAVCAGAGAAELRAAAADVWVTGEMKHHDLLDAQARGVRVILSEHSHAERAYLPILRQCLRALTGTRVDWLLARRDRDPVQLVTTEGSL